VTFPDSQNYKKLVKNLSILPVTTQSTPGDPIPLYYHCLLSLYSPFILFLNSSLPPCVPHTFINISHRPAKFWINGNNLQTQTQTQTQIQKQFEQITLDHSIIPILDYEIIKGG